MEKFLPPLPSTWQNLLAAEMTKDYYIQLDSFLNEAYATQTIFPPRDDIFNALNYTPYPEVKVVILGQDPYHNYHQAQGLSFSVPPTCPLPPSLKNIFKELTQDCQIPLPKNGELIPWAKQGVLLLNTVLTVEAHRANSHKNKGWEQFTNAIMVKLNQHPHPLVFILWGKPAEAKAKLITDSKHLILTAPHPSPLSAHRGFFGCQHFSKANAFLQQHHRPTINWTLT